MGKSFCPFHSIFCNGQNGLKMVWKIVCKMVRKMSRIVWLCEFRGDINGWDLKILYTDWESWKKWLKKIEIKWFVWLGKLKKMRNGIE